MSANKHTSIHALPNFVSVVLLINNNGLKGNQFFKKIQPVSMITGNCQSPPPTTPNYLKRRLTPQVTYSVSFE